MNVRFAEALDRPDPLAFLDAERKIADESEIDGRTKADLVCKCEKDIYIGVFFDGTNNNKYRDTPHFSHSNVARLYEACPGTPAKQTPLPPTQKDVNGRTKTRTVFKDEAFKPSSIPAEDFPYYRKIYVPGVGTPMPDVGDSGTGKQKTGGLAMALLGQVRLDWALLQLVNQVHAAVFNEAIAATVDMNALYKKTGKQSSYIARMVGFVPSLIAEYKLEKPLDEILTDLYRTVGQYDPIAFRTLLAKYLTQLNAALKGRKQKNIKPTIRKIRLSVFGFSRGAAEARAWVNMLNNTFNETSFGGIPLQIDFLGIFDTVASVGLAQSTPYFEGHGAWADGAMMQIPGNVKRCAHLVAAFEVRGSFPLDSVCRGGVLPANCKEIVYPGVHSDVGGGYPPNDQGRAMGNGVAGDAKKISQIPLAQMYREARMAGVPLAPFGDMDLQRQNNFKIDDKLKADFNAYVAATRSGSIPPTNGVSKAVFSLPKSNASATTPATNDNDKKIRFSDMFPTETQPREELFRIVRRHAGIQLRWRKQMMTRGGVATTVDVNQLTANSRFQDREDLRGAEEELKKEIAFLMDGNANKYKTVDDVLFDKYLYQISDLTPNLLAFLKPLLVTLSWGIQGSVDGVMREKQRQWDTWLRDEWFDKTPLPSAASTLFANYVHDSRAWFKALMTSDTEEIAADDEAWFALGGYEQIRESTRNRLNRQIQEANNYRALIDPKDTRALAENKEMIDSRKNALKTLEETGAPLMRGAREPYRMWGYVRHRKIYENGMIPTKLEQAYANYHKSVQQEEDERVRRQQRIDLTRKENASYEEEIKRIKDNANETLRSGRLKPGTEGEYRESTQAMLADRKRSHEEALQKIEAMTN